MSVLPDAEHLARDPRGLPPILLHVSAAEILRDDALPSADGLLPEADDSWSRLGAWCTATLDGAAAEPRAPTSGRQGHPSSTDASVSPVERR